jgi:hypothetical protein
MVSEEEMKRTCTALVHILDIISRYATLTEADKMIVREANIGLLGLEYFEQLTDEEKSDPKSYRRLINGEIHAYHFDFVPLF